MNYGKNESFTPQMRSHLKTTAMRLGLVRLLIDAGRTESIRQDISITASRTDAHRAARSAQDKERYAPHSRRRCP